MKVKVHGARGAYPTSNKENEYYGGSTSCIEVIDGEERIILDAGTGILSINTEAHYFGKRIDILLSHLHIDHIQGLAFFKPLFEEGQEVHLWGPGGCADSLSTRLSRFLSPPLFPVRLRDIPCQLHFHEISNSSFQIGGFHIRSKFVSHPGSTVGYRIQSNSRILTYIPDHEPMIGRMDLYDDDAWVSGFGLAKDSDLLIHDAQYSSDEYQTKIGWGHCSMKVAAEFSSRTKAKHLVFFHHDPEHDDRFRKHMFEEFVKNSDYNFQMQLAVQGSEIEV